MNSFHLCINIFRLTKEQTGLNELTLKHPRRAMLGAPEVLQLNQNLIFAIQAKKVKVRSFHDRIIQISIYLFISEILIYIKIQL